MAAELATKSTTVTNRARTNNSTTTINAAANAVDVVVHAQGGRGVVLLLGGSSGRQCFHFGGRPLRLFRRPFGVGEVGQSGQSGRLVGGRITVGQS